jgi:hypothetical protein
MCDLEREMERETGKSNKDVTVKLTSTEEARRAH